MCILCVVQRWSRRVATMLPWLVIPLLILWALSQLLPPALRFEITSPRLACVLVLLATLFWYEILMPHLSSWRARRASRLRERRRTEALELQKLRKTATRRCRNCHMPYRDQNPGGGRFMCSYCGHISKKPALDLSGPTAGPGMITDLAGKHGWLCDADGNCNWVGSVPKYWIGSDHRCSTVRSYSGVMVFACKLLSFFFSSMRWLCGKFVRFGSSSEDISSDSDHIGSLRKGEITGNFQESRGEKARRKAEEKRQARLEKEILEEEERKQKEEVARLVEERRRLRDETLVAEMERSKGSAVNGDRDGGKEIDKRRRDRRKDKDKASNKSNSDGEDLEKRTSRESERKQELAKKGENERCDLHKSMGDNYKSHALHGVYGSKALVNKPRYFDRMKGTLLSSSRGFSGASFFGRNTQKSAAVAKSVKPATGFIDHGQNAVKRRDAHPVAYVVGKSTSSAGENTSEANLTQPAALDVQPKTVFKTSWQQLFTRSSAVSPYPDSKSTTHVDRAGQLSARGDQLSNQNFPPSYSINNQVQFGQSFTAYPPMSTLFISNPISHIVSETAFPPLKEPPQSSVSEDAELFEDPCYVPDPISLLGPVSESLDNFPLDLETEFTAKSKTEQSPLLTSVSISAEVNKPCPIEPPLSKLHVPEEMHSKSDQLFCNPRSDVSANMNEQSTWQMWGSPVAQEGLGLIGCPSSWFSPVVHNNSQMHDVLHSLPHKPIMPPISKNHNVQRVHASNHQQSGGTYSPLGPSLNDNGIWLQNSPFQSPLGVVGDDRLLPLNLMNDITQSEDTYSSPNKLTAVHPFETHQASSWFKDDFVSHGPQEGGNLNSGSANVGSLFSRGPDVPSVWSFNQ